MAPHELRRELLRELRATRKEMSTAIYLLALREQSENVQREAALKHLAIQQAILALENAQLAEIRDDLVANETAIKKGINDLTAARQQIKKVAKVLEVLGSVLGVLPKVIKLAAGLAI